MASTHRDVLTHEAKIVEQRLALVSMCEESSAEAVNQYLESLAFLPRPKPSEDAAR